MTTDAGRHSSFYWPMRLLPEEKRKALFAVYAYCQAVDALADGPLPRAEKHSALAEWRQEIDALYAGAPTRDITRNLLPHIDRFALSKEAFTDILEGMALDVEGKMLRPSDTLLEQYCYYVASCVGLLAIEIFGHQEASTREFAIELGKALQLINILRDIPEDAERGRIYVPYSLLHSHGMQLLPPALLAKAPPKKLAALRRGLAVRATAHLQQADRLLHPKDRRRMLPALMMRNIYRCYLDSYARNNWHDGGTKPRIPRWRKAGAIMQACVEAV